MDYKVGDSILYYSEFTNTFREYTITEINGQSVYITGTTGMYSLSPSFICDRRHFIRNTAAAKVLFGRRGSAATDKPRIADSE